MKAAGIAVLVCGAVALGALATAVHFGIRALERAVDRAFNQRGRHD